MVNSDRSYRQMQEATKEVAEFAGSPAMRKMGELLDAMAQCYASDLVHVLPEQLLQTQAKLKQVLALRDLVTGASDTAPKI